MTTIAHLSDLHFGTEDAAMAERLAAELHELRPQLTVISGDLTQRARRRQFAAAPATSTGCREPAAGDPRKPRHPSVRPAPVVLAPMTRSATASASA